MSELKNIVENIQSAFADSRYPEDFLAQYDQMECLASHNGRETFLVRDRKTGEMAIAKCYDSGVYATSLPPEWLRQANYPGIPRFYGQYQNQQMICIVREYIEGETLSDLIAERDLPLSGILDILIRLCDILSLLHGHTPPVIHRDIKPENIIVRPDHSIALIDFDISRLQKKHAVTDTVFFGTRGYAPPEQYGFSQSDARSDIYAFGVLTRFLVTGSIRPSPHVHMDDSLQRVIDRCTAFSPEERYDSIDQVRQALLKIRQDRKPLRLKNLIPLLLVLIVALCAGFCAGRYTDWFRSQPKFLFAEPLIERAVRLQLQKEQGNLTEEDLAAVRRIYIYGSEAYGDPDLFYQQTVDQHEEGPLRTLKDLTLLPQLEEIHIIRQGYVDIGEIADLTNVLTVELKHMRISGVQPIANLRRLQHVILFDTGIFDVTSLENCPWLETLDIGLNEINTLHEIGSHPSLRSLGLTWLKIDDLSEISDRMPRLQAVTLQHGDFADLSGLRALPELEAVYVLESQRADAERVFEGTGVSVHVVEN